MAEQEKNMLIHLSSGYRNAQETIRAIDVKTNILTALSVFSFTAILGILKVVWDYLCMHPDSMTSRLSDGSGFSLALPVLLALVLVGSLFTGALCLWFCMATLSLFANVSETPT